MNYETCEWRFADAELDRLGTPLARRALARMDALEELCQRALDALETEQEAASVLRGDVEAFAEEQDAMENAPSTADLRTAINASETDTPEVIELQDELDDI